VIFSINTTILFMATDKKKDIHFYVFDFTLFWSIFTTLSVGSFPPGHGDLYYVARYRACRQGELIKF
jgi:hypothetical protein